MPFTHDIFISYAHIDNQSLDGGEGWTTSLHKRLRLRLHQLLGEKLEIWFDEQEQGSQYLIGLVGAGISDTLLLTTVLTPRYASSEWCRGELGEFCRHADQTGGVYQNGVSRIFCAVKTPVPAKRIPEELAGLRRYEFYEVDANNKVREFSPESGPQKDQKYWDKFEDLAQGIKLAVEKLKPKPEAAPEPVTLPLSKKVYLADTSTDMRPTRDRVMRELLERGYYVLPDDQLPLSVPDFQDAVRAHISNSALSIHLMGEGYGVVPDGADLSIVCLQEQLAAERASDPSFARLVWMPVGLQTSNVRQQSYIEQLKSGLGTDLLQTTVEELKTRILEKLNPKQSLAEPKADSRQLKRVYLICDNRDRDDVVPIEEYLFAQGYEVIPSIHAGEGEEIAQYHRDNLVNCDAALIYYGQASQLWLRLKMSDLLKAPGWGRTRPMLAQAIYVSTPHSPEKQRFRTREAAVIQNFGGFSPDALQPFVGAISAGNGGRK
jgi:hypothetical protein